MNVGGYVGKLLHVDLTSKAIEAKPLKEDYARQFIGGGGLACRMLLDMVRTDTDPLSPENPLVFMTGPLTGTIAPSCGRYTVCAKSPLTRIWGESNSGGFFGPRLKFSGFDGIVITGKAKEPAYLHVHDGDAEFRGASHLVGKTTFEVQEDIIKDIGEERASVACIGPAGENLVKFAAILNDGGRAAGRTGMGAVMGSKRLKAVVVHGDTKVKVADEKKFTEAAAEATNAADESFLIEMFGALGTAGYVDYAQLLGGMSNKYFTEGIFNGAEEISGATMLETILVGNKKCFGCPIGCGRIVRIDSGKYALPDTDGPEFETLAAFGSNLLVDNLEGIAYANYLCNAYGLDTISCGVAIGFTYFLYEKGIIQEGDVKDMKLTWGNIDTAIELIRMIANRDGLGDILAEGTKYMGKHYEVEEFAAHVKGLEVSFQDPRAFSGMTMCYATSPRGACHMQGDMYMVDIGLEFPELGIVSTDRLSDEGKAEVAAKCQNYRALYNSLIMCQIANPPPKCIRDLLTHATGWSFSVNDLDVIGERIFNLKRVFNNRMNITRDDDKLPKLLLTPLKEGGTEGKTPNVQRQLREYYEVRGWDWDTGKPKTEKLKELGLEDLMP